MLPGILQPHPQPYSLTLPHFPPYHLFASPPSPLFHHLSIGREVPETLLPPLSCALSNQAHEPLTRSFSTKSMKAVRSTSTGCPCRSYMASTKWKKLDFLRLEGGCFSKCARARPTPLREEKSWETTGSALWRPHCL